MGGLCCICCAPPIRSNSRSPAASSPERIMKMLAETKCTGKVSSSTPFVSRRELSLVDSSHSHSHLKASEHPAQSKPPGVREAIWPEHPAAMNEGVVQGRKCKGFIYLSVDLQMSKRFQTPLVQGST